VDFKKTIEWYNQNADEYAINSSKISHIDTVKEFLSKLPKNPEVLEAGCGDGRDANDLQLEGAEVTGVDLSSGLLEVARRKYPSVNFIECDIRELPFENASFGAVWAHASLVHFDTVDEVKTAMSEFCRVLKPRGLLYILVKKQTGAEETAVVVDSLSNHERFFRYFTEEGLISLIKNIGFTIDSIEEKNDKHGRDEVIWLKVFAYKS